MERDMREETYIPSSTETVQKSTETQKGTTAIIIANPTAGSYTQHMQLIEESISYLREHGWDVKLKLTKESGDGGRLAREAVEQKLDLVIAVGGDGTINEVIQELAGSETALGVLPSGTVNVWAREMHIPLDDYVAAREILLNGRTRRIDVGKVAGRYFLLMSTLGFDAEVTQTVENTRSLKRFGILGYILTSAWLGFGYPNFTVSMQIGKRNVRMHALQVVIGNTQLYAGAIKFTWEARCDDGLLDICVVRTQGVLSRFSMLYDFLLKSKKRQQWVRYDSSQEIKVHTNRPVAVQVDGDPVGHTARKGFPPTIFSVVPGALKVIIPQDAPKELFTQP
jgi:YegS/Rv2252/BmrU family lipid kinase